MSQAPMSRSCVPPHPGHRAQARRRPTMPGARLLPVVSALALLAGGGTAVGAGVSPVVPVADRPVPAVAADDPAGRPRGVVRLMAVGDVMLARSIGRRIREDGPGVAFRGVRDIVERADLLVVNLECAVTTSRDREDKHYTFRAPPIAARALARGSVDVAGLANNHAMDLGPRGLLDTVAHLEEQGIASVGGGRDRAAARVPLIVERNGLRIAFLAYADAFTESTGFSTRSWAAGPSSPGIAIASARHIRRDVASVKPRVDAVVVLVHAGYEYYPTPNAEQRRYAKAAIDAGATLVLGAHPHVLQGATRTGGRLVAWSLGNFVFDRMGGAAGRSAILSVDLSANGVERLRWIPVRLVDGLPVPS